jgi:hypothetical protein
MTTLDILPEAGGLAQRSGRTDGELADHVETYGGFLHLIRWIALHLLIDVAGVIALIEKDIFLGVLLIACGTLLLIWTILTARRAAASARATVDEVPAT